MKLKPCPFCGHTGATVQDQSDVKGEGVVVVCPCCFAEGPIVYGGNDARDVKPRHRAAARRMWNERK
jgi:Lar family restriction alleviation protein